MKRADVFQNYVTVLEIPPSGVFDALQAFVNEIKNMVYIVPPTEDCTLFAVIMDDESVVLIAFIKKDNEIGKCDLVTYENTSVFSKCAAQSIVNLIKDGYDPLNKRGLPLIDTKGVKVIPIPESVITTLS